jgi:pimeloyl-ACP methyl ester carboxylesterase
MATCAQEPTDGVTRDTLIFLDRSRGRPIQVATYHIEGRPVTGSRVVIMSHGYNDNRPGAYLDYTYLMRPIAAQGYFVVSVQHELPTDELLRRDSIARIVRRPNWERGVTNILFVLDELKGRYPALDHDQVTLIGHSNGGDISMLFAEQHPDLIDKVISLDNRRMPLPRVPHPQVYSLRSSDQPADDGVLPTEAEQASLAMRVVHLPATTHNEMDDDGTAAQHAEIVAYVLEFLLEP